MRLGLVLLAPLTLPVAASAWAEPTETRQPVPRPIAVDAPAFDGRSAYISQIGSANTASARQTAPNARAEIVQRGDGNAASVEQRGSGPAFARVAQTGDGNRLTAVQAGTGRSTLFLDQTGAANAAAVSQTTLGVLHNGAAVTQTGVGNGLTLAQAGEDNRALLSQDGDDNRMSAVQTGTGNRLAWMQQGNGLSDLSIAQEGGQSISVIQTGGRRATP